MAEKERIKTLAKLNGFRKDLLSMDWSDDKIFSAGNRSYGYVSADKVKAQFGPLVAKHGLEMVFNFDDLQVHEAVGMMSQHWTVKTTMTLVDIDTGEGVSFTAYGEAGDSGDKGVNKAQTDGIKQVIFSSFMVADEGDPSAVSAETIAPVTSKYKPKNEAEQVAVKSKVLGAGVPVPKAPAPAPAVPKAQPVKAPAPAVPVPAPVAIKPKETVKSEVPAILQKAINAIIAKATMEVMDGTMTSSEVDALKSEAERISNKAEAEDFIGRHQA